MYKKYICIYIFIYFKDLNYATQFPIFQNKTTKKKKLNAKKIESFSKYFPTQVLFKFELLSSSTISLFSNNSLFKELKSFHI
jgi:hypothetical protein